MRVCKPCYSKFVAPKKREYHYKKKYGLSLEQCAELQRVFPGCAICGSKEKLHIDHDHKSGLVRGLLCGKCNRALGSFDDDVGRLKKAIEYLLFQKRWNSPVNFRPFLRDKLLRKALELS